MFDIYNFVNDLNLTLNDDSEFGLARRSQIFDDSRVDPEDLGLKSISEILSNLGWETKFSFGSARHVFSVKLKPLGGQPFENLSAQQFAHILNSAYIGDSEFKIKNFVESKWWNSFNDFYSLNLECIWIEDLATKKCACVAVYKKV